MNSLIEKLRTLLEESQKSEVTPIEEQLPTKIQKNRLHDVLGYDPDVNLATIPVNELIQKQIDAIKKKTVDYKTMVSMLNWVQVMNKTKNPKFSNAMKQVIQGLEKEFSNPATQQKAQETIEDVEEIEKVKKTPVEKVVESINKYITINDIIKEHPEIEDKINLIYEFHTSELLEKVVQKLLESEKVIVYLNENANFDVIDFDKFDPINMVYVEMITIDKLKKDMK